MDKQIELKLKIVEKMQNAILPQDNVVPKETIAEYRAIRMAYEKQYKHDTDEEELIADQNIKEEIIEKPINMKTYGSRTWFPKEIVKTPSRNIYTIPEEKVEQEITLKEKVDILKNTTQKLKKYDNQIKSIKDENNLYKLDLIINKLDESLLIKNNNIWQEDILF